MSHIYKYMMPCYHKSTMPHSYKFLQLCYHKFIMSRKAMNKVNTIGYKLSEFRRYACPEFYAQTPEISLFCLKQKINTSFGGIGGHIAKIILRLDCTHEMRQWCAKNVLKNNGKDSNGCNQCNQYKAWNRLILGVKRGNQPEIKRP